MVALMCVLPFLVPHHRNPLTTFYGEWLAAALGLAAATLLLRRASWQPFRFPLVALVPLGLMVVLGVQVAMGLAVYWQQHFLVGLYLFWAVLMVVLGAELRREFGLEKIVPVLAWAVLAGGVLSAAIVGVQMSGVHLMPYIVPREFGYGANLMQVNHLADYLGLALASLLYLAATARLKTGWAALLALVLLFPLALTGQRMGWIYVVMLAVGSWWVGRRAGKQSWRALWLIPAFMALQVVIPLLPITGAPAMATHKVMAGLQGPSIRLQLIREAWQIFLAHPWLGAGWGQFGWQDFLLAEKYPDHTGWATHAHNIVMQLLAETGLAGALILVVGAGYWARHALPAEKSLEAWWCVAILAVLGVHALLEYPLWYGYFLGLVAIILGLSIEKSLRVTFSLGPVVAIGTLAFSLFVISLLLGQYTRLEGCFNRALMTKVSAPETPALLDELADTSRKSLFAPVADVVILHLLPNSPALISDKLEISQKGVRYLPAKHEVYGHATLLALAGEQEAALATLRSALIRYPDNADQYAVTLMRIGSQKIMPLLVEVGRFNRDRFGIALPRRRGMNSSH